MEQPTNLFDLQVDQQSERFLSETARWGRFLSITGFVFCGLMVLIGIFAGSFFQQTAGAQMGALGALGMGSFFFTILYLVMAAIAVIPCLHLYNFSGKMKVALATQDQSTLNQSFKHLKSCFRFYGILTLIVIGFYALALIFGLIAGAFS